MVMRSKRTSSKRWAVKEIESSFDSLIIEDGAVSIKEISLPWDSFAEEEFFNDYTDGKIKVYRRNGEWNTNWFDYDISNKKVEDILGWLMTFLIDIYYEFNHLVEEEIEFVNKHGEEENVCLLDIDYDEILKIAWEKVKTRYKIRR